MKERKYCHYVFTTYKRENTLADKELKSFLIQCFFDIAKDKMISILSVSILSDHIHLLIEQKLNDMPEYIMKCIKGISSRRFFDRYSSTNRFVFRKLWGRSYYCEEIDPEDLNKVVSYIDNQTDKNGLDKRYFAGVNKEPRRLASGSKGEILEPATERRGPMGLTRLTHQTEPRRLASGSKGEI